MKPIIIYGRHRNTEDIRKRNSKEYIFLDFSYIHKVAKIVKLLTKSEKLYAKTIYCLLKLIKPKAILSCNWITKAQRVFYLYSQRNDCKSIVVQHGAYFGGIVTAKNHRYMKCDIFWVWGEYFKEVFDRYNPSKKNNILVLGNPVFNSFDRKKLSYPKSIKNVLIAFSFLRDEQLNEYRHVVQNIFNSNYNVSLKYHNFQKNKFVEYSKHEIKGDFSVIVHKYDLIITDRSTVLLDVIFFKKYVIYADKSNVKTYYEEFLFNNFRIIAENKFQDLVDLIDMTKQERLIKQMCSFSDNKIEGLLEK